MPTLLERAEHAADPNFQRRVAQGMLEVAEEVIEEDRNTTENDARRRLAQSTFVNPNGHAVTMAQRVVLVETFGSSPNDPDANDPANDSPAGDEALLYVLRNYWSDLAIALGYRS